MTSRLCRLAAAVCVAAILCLSQASPVSALVPGTYAGTTAPTNPQFGQIWIDTTTTPRTLRSYDGAQWVATATLNATTHVWVPIINGLPPAPSATTDTTNAANIATGTLNGGRLPVPTSSILGGVTAATAPSHQYQTGISTAGAPTFGQPVVGDVAGALSKAGDTSIGPQFVPPVPCTTNSLTVTTAANAWSCGAPVTPQMYGAVGDGTTNDTAAIAAWLGSGRPLVCSGSFNIVSLISLSNVDIFAQGSHRGCTLIYSTAQSMIAITEAPANKVTLRDIAFSIRAAITSVTGPAKTAALLISYTGPGGVHNGPDVSVDLERLNIQPDAAGHYITNGIYLLDTNVSRVRDTFVGGDTGTLRNTAGIVFDSQNSSSTAYFEHNFGQMLATGISVPAPSSGTLGFQGVRIHDFDCVQCVVGVNAAGSADGTSDYLDVSGVEGTFSNVPVTVANVGHVMIHHNYAILTNVTGAPTTAGPICFNYAWTGTLATKPDFNISDNTCDGAQITGYSSRIGVNIQGNSNIAMAGIVGPNALSNLDFGVALQAGTAGVLVMPQSTTLVTTPITNAATAGQNTRVVPTSY